jgi:hypothetical protein
VTEDDRHGIRLLILDRILLTLKGCFIGLGVVSLLLLHHAAAQQGPRINPLTQVTSYNPSAVLFWYVGTASGLPACGVAQTNGSPGPPLPSLAYITGPPDQIEACMTGSAGPEWVQVVTAP